MKQAAESINLCGQTHCNNYALQSSTGTKRLATQPALCLMTHAQTTEGKKMCRRNPILLVCGMFAPAGSFNIIEGARAGTKYNNDIIVDFDQALDTVNTNN